MDSSEKIVVAHSFEQLAHAILNDRDSRDIRAQRYPVRFIMLNNFDVLRRLTKFLAELGVDTLDLEQLAGNGDDDEWITKDMLMQAVKNCKSSASSVLITPFSEIVRFYNDDDFRGFMNEAMLIEDIRNPHRRIYIPLIGLQNRFTDFLNHFGRIRESAPIWRYDDAPQSVEVFLVAGKDFRLPKNDAQCQLFTFRDWLRFWKVQAPQRRMVCMSRPIVAKHKYSRPDNIFDFKKIGNAYEFMTQFLELRLPFACDDDDKPYWEQLLAAVSSGAYEYFSFEAFVHKHFNRVSLEAPQVIAEWSDAKRTPFDRWLLKNYAMHTDCAETYPYMALCMEAVQDLADNRQLTYMVATRIVYDLQKSKQTAYAHERRKTMRDNASLFASGLSTGDQEWLFEQVKAVRNNDLDFAIDLCTGIFDFEKKLLMGWWANHTGVKKIHEATQELYPEFIAYMSSSVPSVHNADNNWFVDYIKAYKQAKLKDRQTDDIVSAIHGRNATAKDFYQWYFSFDSSRDALAAAQKSHVYHPDRVYWIDGLGAEFLSYILHVVEQENSSMRVVQSQITRSQLPTSTRHNRFEGDSVVKFAALDEIGHDAHGYKPFDTLIRELATVGDMVREIVNACKKDKCTVAIVSDHGMSCLSRKFPSKKYDGRFEHEGRYIKTTDDAQSDTDYLVHKNEDDGQTYKVALTHSSLSRVPTHQVHGGCTPEEVLVPFILLSNKNVAKAVKYQIKVVESEIMLSDPTLAVSIIPQPSSVALTFNGHTFPMESVGTQWKARIDGMTEGKHTLDIQIEGSHSKQVEITAIGVGGGMDINETFDL